MADWDVMVEGGMVHSEMIKIREGRFRRGSGMLATAIGVAVDSENSQGCLDTW
jgi:hypothetical protein